MKQKALAAAIALTFSLSTGLVLAQTAPQQQQPNQETLPELQGGQQTQQGGAMGADSLSRDQLADLEGKKVTDSQGEEIGDVTRLVESIQDQQPYAVLSVGGFLGIGDTEVAIPLSELQVVGDDLRLTTGDTKEQIEQRADEYQEQNFRELDL